MTPIPGFPFRGKDAPREAYRHLKENHGVDESVASNRLHKIKDRALLGPTDDVVIGRTGDVYNAATGERIGSLTDTALGSERSESAIMLFHEKSKLEHVFVVCRFDAYMVAEFGMKPDYVTVTRVVRSEEIADREVERLNRLNGHKGCVYFWRSARLDRDIRLGDDPGPVEADLRLPIPTEQQA
jgi:hypothetical protein